MPGVRLLVQRKSVGEKMRSLVQGTSHLQFGNYKTRDKGRTEIRKLFNLWKTKNIIAILA